MIVHIGKKSRIIQICSDIESKCEKCDSPTRDYIVNQSYYHLYGIPIIPLLKSVNIYCHSCKDVIENVHNQEAEFFESQTKTPIYLYTIATGIFILITIGVIRGLL